MPTPRPGTRQLANRRRPRAKRGAAQNPLRLVKRRHSLVYGMRLVPDRVLADGEHRHVPLPEAGADAALTLHVISGDKEEIRRRLLESIDAFFDIFGEDLP